MVVSKTLVSPKDEAPIDVAEIAMLACKEAPLFVLMMTAAYKVLGITEEEQKTIDTFDAVAAGNSGGAVAMN
jgi:hypothetical protein